MRVRVRLFATYREIVGSRDLLWTLEEGSTVEAFLKSFLLTYPRLAGLRDTMMFAVNQAFAVPQAVLHEGDEVALLPPVSGGAQ